MGNRVLTWPIKSCNRIFQKFKESCLKKISLPRFEPKLIFMLFKKNPKKRLLKKGTEIGSRKRLTS